MLQDLEQLAGDINKFQAYLCTSTHTNQVARCVAQEYRFFENLLYAEFSVYQGQFIVMKLNLET